LVNNAALRRTIHPVHAVLLAGSLPLFLGALLTEIYFILGIVGGAKKNKEQKAARQAQAGDRKRR
jgi:hypothetical protein